MTACRTTVVCFCLVALTGLALLSGCGGQAQPAGPTVAATPAEASPVRLRLAFLLDPATPPEVRADVQPSAPATWPEVQVLLKLLDPGQTMRNRSVLATPDENRRVAVEIEDLPPWTALAEVSVRNGTIASHTFFHGALDLEPGENLLVVHPAGSLLSQDIVAEGVASVMAEQERWMRAPAGLASRTHGLLGEVDRRTPWAYEQIRQLAASRLLALPANVPPSFTPGADITLTADVGTYTVATWATAISAGPASESEQTVDFVMSNNRPDLFITQPALTATGALSFVVSPRAHGTASIAIRLRDSGGTESLGIDRSATHTLQIDIRGSMPWTLHDNVLPAQPPDATTGMWWSFHDATVLNDKILLTGANQDTIYEIDPVNWSWTPLASVPAPMTDCRLFTHEGIVYLFSSIDRQVWTFDRGLSSFTAINPMPGVAAHAGVVAFNSRIYLFNQFNAFEFVPGTNTWSQYYYLDRGNAPAGAVVHQNQVYIFGGDQNRVYRLNPDTPPTLEPLSYIPVNETVAAQGFPWRGGGRVVQCNGRVFYLGGVGVNANLHTSFPVTDVDEYDPVNDRWIPRTSLQRGIANLAVVAIGNRIHVLGGSMGRDVQSATIDF